MGECPREVRKTQVKLNALFLHFQRYGNKEFWCNCVRIFLDFFQDLKYKVKTAIGSTISSWTLRVENVERRSLTSGVSSWTHFAVNARTVNGQDFRAIKTIISITFPIISTLRKNTENYSRCSLTTTGWTRK